MVVDMGILYILGVDLRTIYNIMFVLDMIYNMFIYIYWIIYSGSV